MEWALPSFLPNGAQNLTAYGSKTSKMELVCNAVVKKGIYISVRTRYHFHFSFMICDVAPLVGNCEYTENEIRRDGVGIRFVNSEPVEVQVWNKKKAQPANTSGGKWTYIDPSQFLGKGCVRGWLNFCMYDVTISPLLSNVHVRNFHT